MFFSVEYSGHRGQWTPIIGATFDTELAAEKWALWNYKGSRLGWRIVPCEGVATFKIECGEYSQTIKAPSFEAAIAVFSIGKDRQLLGDLLRIREIPWNTKYVCDDGKEKRRGCWHYVVPPATTIR